MAKKRRDVREFVKYEEPRRDLETIQGGGTRSEKAPGHHLVPREGPRRIALRFDLGAETHGANNWKKSCQSEKDAYVWCVAAYNHLMEHALKMSPSTEKTMLTQDEYNDDHLGAIGWAVCVIAYCEAKFCKKWTELDK